MYLRIDTQWWSGAIEADVIILEELIKLLLPVFFSNSNEIPVKASINVSKYFVTVKFPGYIKPEIKDFFDEHEVCNYLRLDKQ